MRIDRIVVAVPARDEEDLLPASLAAVDRAAAAVTHADGVTVDVVVALDGCRDSSAEVAHASGALTVTLPGLGVGAARHAAVCRGLEGSTLEATWVANTDADTLVPEDWLTTQLSLAHSGVDVIVGTVEPVGEADPRVVAAWHERHRLVEGHEHVHGANLGIRASTYAAVGGFRPLALHEDVDLIARARAAGAVVVATDSTRVRTSDRTGARVEDGFGGYVRALADEILHLPATPATTRRFDHAVGSRPDAPAARQA